MSSSDELLEYLIRFSGGTEAAGEVRKVTEQVDRLESAQKRVVRSSSTLDGATARLHSRLSRLGSAASSMASKFVGAIDRMRAAAAKPIRVVTERMRSGRGGGGGMLGGVLGGLGAGLLGVASIEGLKNATEQTSHMVLQATTMNRVMGMNANTAMQWIAVAGAYGIANRTLTMSFRTLATQVSQAGQGTKASVELFKRLGISQRDLKSHSHDLSGMLGLVADKLNKLPPGANKTAIAAKLLGRGFQQMLPMLAEGSKGLEQQRKLAAAYGVTLGKDPLENLRKLHEASINLKLAQTGLQVQLAEHVAPAFIKVFDALIKVWRAITQAVGPAFKWLGEAIHNVTGWLRGHHDAAIALRDGLIVLAGGLGIVTVATAAWTLALSINPITLIIAAIAALVVGIVYCYEHFKTFRDIVNGVWSWLKGAVVDTVHFVSKHWQLLATVLGGPFLAIPALIAGSFQGIKTGVVTVLNWIIGKLNWFIRRYNDVVGIIPFANLTIGQIPYIGGDTGPGAPMNNRLNGPHGPVSAAQNTRNILRHLGNQTPRASKPAGAGHVRTADIILNVDGRQFARITRDQIHKAQMG